MTQQQNSGQSQGQDNGDNPAWNEFLDGIPESLHGVVKQKLATMDQGFQRKLQDVRGEFSGYEQYKDLIEQGVDPRYIEGALHLTEQIQSNPDAVIEQVNKAFGKHYQQVDSNANSNNDDDDDDDYDGVDIANHPVVKQMAEQLSTLQQGYQTREQQEQQEAAQREYEETLEALHTDKNGNRVEFNDLVVTALVSQGATPEEAVQAYQNIIQSEVSKMVPTNETKDTSPVVMGGAGTAGAGIPNQEVNFGKMKDGEVQDMVAEIIRKQQESSE